MVSMLLLLFFAPLYLQLSVRVTTLLFLHPWQVCKTLGGTLILPLLFLHPWQVCKTLGGKKMLLLFKLIGVEKNVTAV